MAPQVLKLLGAQLEHESIWEAVKITPDRPDQGLGLDAVDCREIGVEHDSLAANLEDCAFNSLNRNHAARSGFSFHVYVLPGCAMLLLKVYSSRLHSNRSTKSRTVEGAVSVAIRGQDNPSLGDVKPNERRIAALARREGDGMILESLSPSLDFESGFLDCEDAEPDSVEDFFIGAAVVPDGGEQVDFTDQVFAAADPAPLASGSARA